MMRPQGSLWRFSRALAAVAVLVAGVVAVSGYADASSSRHKGEWPNIALPSQSAWTPKGRMTVTPITVGPRGAEFRVSLPKGYALAKRNSATLTIANRDWPLDRRSGGHQEKGRRVVDLEFDKGGPSVGWMKLTIRGSDGQTFVFAWFLPGGGI